MSNSVSPSPPSISSPPSPDSPLSRLSRTWWSWTRRAETGYMLLLSVMVGLSAGLVATGYRLALFYSDRLFYRTHGLAGGAGSAHLINNLIRCLMPAVGGLIVGLLVYRILRIKGGHGVPALIKAAVTGHLDLPPSMAVKSGLSVVTIASGGSAGPEGPIVEIGAVVGSAIGRVGQVTRQRMGTLVGCGVASGIAAVFNSPLGGVFFALELILREFTVPQFAPVVLSAVIASVTTQILLPHQQVFRFPPEIIATIAPNFSLILAFGLMGPLCALFSAVYITAIDRTQNVFRRAARIPTWAKPAIGGLMVGALSFFLSGIQGEGYEFLNEHIFPMASSGGGGYSLFGSTALGVILMMLIYAVVKMAATALTLGSGFVGGAFAPAMVIGAFLGMAYGWAAGYFFPGVMPSPIVFSLVGMAGVVAGALNTPFSAVLILYEVTGGRYEILFPLMISVATAVPLARRLKPGTVYTLSLLRDGFDVDAATQKRDPLAGLTVAEAMIRDVPLLNPGDTLNEIIDRVSKTDVPAFCVVSDSGRFLGLISVTNLRPVLTLGEEMGPLLLASEIADPNARCLLPSSPLPEALAIFTRSDVEAIPILDPNGDRKILGILYRRALLNLYRSSASVPPFSLPPSPPSEIPHKSSTQTPR